MIKDSFMYIAILIFISSLLIYLPIIFKGKIAQKIFSFAPPTVLIYVGLMTLCTIKVWDLKETAQIYSAIKNPILYAMLFIMLLRCNLKKIFKLGYKMLIGFFGATFTIGLGFIVAYYLMKDFLGTDAWRALGSLCGSWMGGTGNMLAIETVLGVEESQMVYALVMDSICATIYVMFLLWTIGFSKVFNKWTKANTKTIDEVGESLKKEAITNTKPLIWQNIILLLGFGLFVSSISSYVGSYIYNLLPILDKTTWTILFITLLGVILAPTPLGKIKGTEEVSNILLYIVIALIASRADLSATLNAPIWLLTGFIIMITHILCMLIIAKIFKLDIFTCAVSSLANIGGTATAPILAGSYSSALVPVGIFMALLGYIVGTGGGLIVAQIMSIIS